MVGEDTRFGPILATIRVAYGSSQDVLASNLGEDSAYVARWESDECIPSWDILASIAEALDIPMYLIVYMLEKSNGCLCEANPGLDQEVGVWFTSTLKGQVEDLNDEGE